MFKESTTQLLNRIRLVTRRHRYQFSEISAEKILKRLYENNQPTSIERKIRQMVEAGSKWNQLKPLVETLIDESPTHANIALSIELACITGKNIDIVNFFRRVSFQNKIDGSFFRFVNSRIRQFLVEKALRDDFIKESLLICLQKLRGIDESKLLNDEKMLLLLHDVAFKSGSEIYSFFSENKKSLLHSLLNHAPTLGSVVDETLFYLGNTCQSLGFNRDAIELYSSILPGSLYYPDALSQINKLDHPSVNSIDSEFENRILRAKSTAEKIVLMTQFLKNTEAATPENKVKRPKINSLLQKFLTYIDRKENDWMQFSKFISSHISAAELYPGMFDEFRERAACIEEAQLERGMWTPLSKIDASSGALRYIKGVAFIHMFLIHRNFEIGLVLKGVKLIENSAKDVIEARNILDSLRVKLQNKIRENPYLIGRTSNHKILGLNFLKLTQDISCADVEQTLETISDLSGEQFEQFWAVASEKANKKLQLKLLLKWLSKRRLSNDQLDKLWSLSVSGMAIDYSWRVLSVVRSREVLSYDFWFAYESSGEIRNSEKILELPRDILLEGVSIGFNDAQASLAKLLVLNGHQFWKLMELCQSSTKFKKFKFEPSKEILGRVQRRLFESKCLKVPEKTPSPVRDKKMPGLINIMSRLESDSFYKAIVISFVDILGVSAIAGSVHFLNEEIESYLPILGNKKYPSKQNEKLKYWFERLPRAEKDSFIAARGITSKLSETESLEVMILTILKVAVMIFPYHEEAIACAQKLKYDIFYVKHLENFILSNDYSKIRRHLNISHSNPVPLSLTNRTSVLAKS